MAKMMKRFHRKMLKDTTVVIRRSVIGAAATTGGALIASDMTLILVFWETISQISSFETQKV